MPSVRIRKQLTELALSYVGGSQAGFVGVLAGPQVVIVIGKRAGIVRDEHGGTGRMSSSPRWWP